MNKTKQREELLAECLRYIDSLQKRKFITPYHYVTLKEGKDGVKQPGQINVHELAAHVLTADNLGRETNLTVNGETLNVSLVERFTSVPYSIRVAISDMKCGESGTISDPRTASGKRLVRTKIGKGKK